MSESSENRVYELNKWYRTEFDTHPGSGGAGRATWRGVGLYADDTIEDVAKFCVDQYHRVYVLTNRDDQADSW